MKILVCGGRTFRDQEYLYRFLDQAIPITLLITGAQRKWENGRFIGADWLAIEWAQSREIPFIGVPAKWNSYGAGAGPIRNALMIDDWKPQGIIAFPGNNGTRHMIAVAEAAGIPVTMAGW